MATGRFMHTGSACIMIGFRSDHACMIQNSETDWMRARGQPASTRAWPAASGQLAGFHFAIARVLVAAAISSISSGGNGRQAQTVAL